MTDHIRSPAELRAMFGSNLKRLVRQYPTVSGLCRQLGINRTQFNRYLTGESFPRPEVLDRICRFFDVDARILLTDLDDIPRPADHPATPLLTEFLGSGSDASQNAEFPSGFYSVTERDGGRMLNLLYARRLPQCTLVRGYTPRSTLPSALPKAREIQGIAAGTAEQTYILMSRRNGENSQLYLISRSKDGGEPGWSGTLIAISNPSRDDRQTRLINLRHLGQDAKAVLGAARKAAKPQLRALEAESG